MPELRTPTSSRSGDDRVIVITPGTSFAGFQQGPNNGAGTRRKRWYPARDSLALRERQGRPGSRRYRRWLNNEYLAHDSDSEEEDDVWETSSSAFRSIFEQPSKAAAWNAFWHTPEEEQHRHLCRMQRVPPPLPDLAHSTLMQRFARIDRNIRKTLLRNVEHRGFLDAIEPRLVEYIQYLSAPTSFSAMPIDTVYFAGSIIHACDGAEASLQLEVKDAWHRLLIHGVCQFYGLVSHSEDASDGRRITVIRKPHAGGRRKRGRAASNAQHSQSEAIPLPTSSLADYLVSMRGK